MISAKFVVDTLKASGRNIVKHFRKVNPDYINKFLEKSGMKKCPFCGYKKYGSFSTAADDNGNIRAFCFNLGCDAMGPAQRTRVKAIEAWNRRV